MRAVYKILDRFHPSIKDSEHYVYSDDPIFGDTYHDRLRGFMWWVSQHGRYHSEVIQVGDLYHESHIRKLLINRKRNFKLPNGSNRGATADEEKSIYQSYNGWYDVLIRGIRHNEEK